MDEIIRWEYRLETIGSAWKSTPAEAIQEMLNDWGGEGWEVIAFHPIQGSNKITIVAKRVASSRRPRKTIANLQW